MAEPSNLAPSNAQPAPASQSESATPLINEPQDSTPSVRRPWDLRLCRSISGSPLITQKEYDERQTKTQVQPSNDEEAPSVVLEEEPGEKPRVVIQSQYLVDAIAAVNKHPPLRAQFGPFFEYAPYPTLFHHLEDVRAEIEKLNDEDALVDFQALEFVAKQVALDWREAREDSFESGFVRYDMLWKLFNAGDFVLQTDELGNDWLLVLVEVQDVNDTQRTNRGAILRSDRFTELVCWGLIWDSVENVLKRKVHNFRIRPFVGAKPITSLPAWPIKYSLNKEQDAKASLVARGRKWWKLIATPTTCLRYDGPAYKTEGTPQARGYIDRGRDDRLERTKLEDRVIIDRDSKRAATWAVLGDSEETDTGYYRRPYTSYSAPQLDTREAYQWDSIPATQELTDEQAMLCPALIGCYSIKTKELYTVTVEKLSPVQWNTNAMKHLVLGPDKKSMLQGLISRHYDHDRNKPRGDLIEGKGEGLVILLHGPPGVGKTLTAESLAEVVQKPLLALSVGDLIWDETQLQARLQAEFQRAINWDAILLLDEADVVLEARSFEDLRRNGIVSVFLRQLEYYGGVLFLTTNRINTMDAAFESRIQVGIGFKELTVDIRHQIWAKLLQLKGRSHILSHDKLQELSKRKLNGRQIRNVLNVAEGYAFNEFGVQGMMEARHISEAVKAVLEFQQYLEQAKSSLKLEQSVWNNYRGDSEFF